MPNGLFDEFKNKSLGMLFGKRSELPDTIYIGLSTTSINADGTGITEISGSGYERVAIINNSTNWTEPLNEIVKNVNTITFNTSTSNWNEYNPYNGVLYAFFTTDPTETTGNLIGFCDITYKFIQSGTTLLIKSDKLTLSYA